MSAGNATTRPRLLENKTAILSGCGPGLGRDTALALARHGARVALLARSPANLAAVARDLEAEGAEVITLQTDITSSEDCKNAAVAVAKQWGTIDVLVNNAFTLGETKAFLDADIDADWRAPFEVNLFGTLRLSQQVARHMCIAGSGSIVMINTLSVRTPIISKEFGAYAASKGALRTAARYLAEELGPRGIRVNTVTPGQILGDALLAYLDRKAAAEGKTGKELRASIEARLPLRHLVGSDEIADAVVFFASDLSRAVTGTELDVNGGEFIPG